MGRLSKASQLNAMAYFICLMSQTFLFFLSFFQVIKDHICTLQEFTQWPTYPQLLVKGELLGGCDIIMEMQQDGSLKSAVQEALGAQPDSKKALEQRLQELLSSSPVMLFMKASMDAKNTVLYTFATLQLLPVLLIVSIVSRALVGPAALKCCAGGEVVAILFTPQTPPFPNRH